MPTFPPVPTKSLTSTWWPLSSTVVPFTISSRTSNTSANNLLPFSITCSFLAFTSSSDIPSSIGKLASASITRSATFSDAEFFNDSKTSVSSACSSVCSASSASSLTATFFSDWSSSDSFLAWLASQEHFSVTASSATSWASTSGVSTVSSALTSSACASTCSILVSSIF